MAPSEPAVLFVSWAVGCRLYVCVKLKCVFLVYVGIKCLEAKECNGQHEAGLLEAQMRDGILTLALDTHF